MIRVGDRVKFLNDVGTGTVLSIKGAIAIVDVVDGFEVPAQLTDLVSVAQEEELAAIQKIGVSDYKPGKVQRPQGASAQDKAEPKKRAAYTRYGRVSLVDEYEEDGTVDVMQLKETYLKNMAAINAKSLLVEEQHARENKARKEATEKEALAASEAELKEREAAQKRAEDERPKKIDLTNLDKALNIKVGGLSSVATVADAISQKPKAPASDIEVVDLHANEVLPKTEGLAPGEIITAQLARFNMALSLAVKSGKHGKIVFIHGVGSGKLKYELQKELKASYGRLAWQDASFAEYGYGAIMIFY